MLRAIPMIRAALAALVLAACSGEPVQPTTEPAAALVPLAMRGAEPERVVPGEVIVKLKEGATAAQLSARYGAPTLGRGMPPGFALLRVDVGDERAAAARLAADPRVAYAEPNYLRQPLDGRDAQKRPGGGGGGGASTYHTWAFYNPGGLTMKYKSGRTRGQPLPSEYASLADKDEDADPSGGSPDTYGAGGTDVVVGSIDTGVDFAHPEFAGRLIAGRDWYDGDDDPADGDGHGTHTTGTMAGSTVGVAGVAGAGPKVKVYVQRVCGPIGCPTSAIVSAIRAAADVPGMVALNVSLGGGSESQAEKDAIAYALSQGVLVIASAGNDNTGTVSCPACDPNAISVAATNWRDQITYYSNWGPGLDIAAPGGECYSNTTPEGCIYSAYPGGGYAWMQGTSMAAPQVTGTAAVVASKHANLRGAQLRDRLLGTGEALTSGVLSGVPRLNTYRAVTGSALGGGQ